tara:strand:- start:434 stop:1033 length:600 start_codon:yes stop_codon:yes gene_type:complete
MLNLNFRYDQNSARLEVEGLPDISQGHDTNKLGILSSWKLKILGFPELEGKKEHLQNLIGVIYPYTQHYIEGEPRSFGNETSPVSIYSTNENHKLILRSSQKSIPPLEILLDHAEISDLLYCLDMLINDERILFNLEIPNLKPLPDKISLILYSKIQSFFAPLLAASLLFSVSTLMLFIPIPNEIENTKFIQKELINKQ